MNTGNKLLESGILDGAMATKSLKMVIVEARLCEEGRELKQRMRKKSSTER